MNKTAFSIVLCLFGSFAFCDGAETNEYVNGGVAYARRGSLGRDDFVATNVNISANARVLPDYLYELHFDDTYPEDAKAYYDEIDGIGMCSARRRGNFLERNYDWKISEAATFVGHVSAKEGRYASVGLMSVGDKLKNDDVKSGKWSKYYKALCGMTLDGINSEGVVAEMNVVTAYDEEWEGATSVRTINALGAVRWVLDNASTARYAAEILAAHVYIPQSLIRLGYSVHYMIADENETWIVEDGRAVKADTVELRSMTNFHLLSDYAFEGGFERYNMLVAGTSITNTWFTNAYLPTIPWITEFVGEYDADGKMSKDDTLRLRAWAEEHVIPNLPPKADGNWWRTVHTSVYDIKNRSVKVSVHEIDDWYTFNVVNHLQNDYTSLTNNANFRNAVAQVSPPTELPENWALANVTNASGNAISIEDFRETQWSKYNGRDISWNGRLWVYVDDKGDLRSFDWPENEDYNAVVLMKDDVIVSRRTKNLLMNDIAEPFPYSARSRVPDAQMTGYHLSARMQGLGACECSKVKGITNEGYIILRRFPKSFGSYKFNYAMACFDRLGIQMSPYYDLDFDEDGYAEIMDAGYYYNDRFTYDISLEIQLTGTDTIVVNGRFSSINPDTDFIDARNGGWYVGTFDDIPSVLKKSEIAVLNKPNIDIMVARTFSESELNAQAIVNSFTIPKSVIGDAEKISRIDIRCAYSDSGIWDNSAKFQLKAGGTENIGSSSVGTFVIGEYTQFTIQSVLSRAVDNFVTFDFKKEDNSQAHVRLGLVKVSPDLGYSITLSNGNVVHDYAPLIDIYGLSKRENAIDSDHGKIIGAGSLSEIENGSNLETVIQKVNNIIKSFR